MQLTLTNSIRKIWPDAIHAFGKLAKSEKNVSFRLPDLLVPPDMKGLISIYAELPLPGLVVYPAFSMISLVNEPGELDSAKQSLYHAKIVFNETFIGDTDDPQNRRMFLNELVYCIDAISRHGSGHVDPIFGNRPDFDIPKDLTDLWEFQVEAKEQTKSSILLVDSILYAAMKEEPQLIYSLDDRQFEEYVEDLLRRKGFKTELTKRSRDGGKDIIAERIDIDGTHRLIVECKHYTPPNHVGIDVVQRLYGVQEALRATRGVVATSSFFTNPAKEFAGNVSSRLTLWDYFDIGTLTKELCEQHSVDN